MSDDQATTYAKVAPYLMVDDGVAAIAFYKQAFGAQERDRYDWEGKIGHVGLTINGSDVMLSDEFPDVADIVGTKAPKTLGGTTSTINLNVDDVDAWHDRAVAAGAKSLRAPKDEFYGRQAKMRDPFGHVWGLVGPKTA
jgi:PhnB protein